ncbi:hypothetical protein P886_2190 [Alteromonadaceae bacterium 2753L.S.0a.02]|nr:hypothetical protein P886_2190 [Alteromonadaceae bacterium 2753L.S.0a.02]
MNIKNYIAIIILMNAVNCFASCGLENAKVIDVHQYFDGNIFVRFDKSTNCNCIEKTRLAFDSGDPTKQFIQSMVLLAFASNSNVTAYSSSTECSVHGNTAVLDYFRVLK